MDSSEWLTRGTIWLAVSLYVAAALARAASRDKTLSATERWLTTAGCAAFLAHVACAFHFYHHWSHAMAYADTARQTEQFSGWNWGGGLFVNYAFALVWLGEVIWLWAKPESYLQRPTGVTWTVRGFFLFMMFNGAVVFVRGSMRWFGLALCLALVGCWWPRRQRSIDPLNQPKSI